MDTSSVNNGANNTPATPILQPTPVSASVPAPATVTNSNPVNNTADVSPVANTVPATVVMTNEVPEKPESETPSQPVGGANTVVTPAQNTEEVEPAEEKALEKAEDDDDSRNNEAPKESDEPEKETDEEEIPKKSKKEDDEDEDDDEEDDESERKSKSSKKKSKGTKKRGRFNKKIALIIGLALGIVAIIGVLVYFIFFKKEPEPEIVLSDVQFLADNGAWEKQDAPTVIWSLHVDGTGEITTNKKNYYDITWSLEQESDSQMLKIKTKWLYDLDDVFTIKIDKDANSFTVINHADDAESVFVPLGTYENTPKEERDKKDTEDSDKKDDEQGEKQEDDSLEKPQE